MARVIHSIIPQGVVTLIRFRNALRFVVIVFPIRSRSLCTMSNCKRLMVVTWFLSITLAMPVIFIKVTRANSHFVHTKLALY